MHIYGVGYHVVFFMARVRVRIKVKVRVRVKVRIIMT